MVNPHTTALLRLFPRGDGIHLLAVFLGVLLVYVWSMPVTVVLEDDGFFILAARYNGVAHPPGYPLFVMLAHAFTWLPVGSVAFRVHLASACFGAAACALAWLLMRRIAGGRVYAYVTALGLGYSATFWSQAVIAEVYTLNVLLFLLLFMLAWEIRGIGEGQTGLLKWLAFIYGLALSNHWPLIGLSTPALIVLVWPARRGLLVNFPRYAPFLLLGLLPYAWLVWRSHAVPAYSFAGPFDTVRELWEYVSRRHYAEVDHSITAGWPDKAQFLLYAIRETAAQLGPAGTPLAILGLWHAARTGWRLALAMGLAFLGSTLFLILLRDVDYDYFQQATFRVFPLISYLMCWMWAGFGVKFIVTLVAARSGKAGYAATLARALALLLTAWVLLANAPVNYRRNDFLAADYARVILGSLAPDAVFYSNADNIDGPVHYLNRVENFRPDVTAYSGTYLIHDDRLYRPFRLEQGKLRNLVNDFIGETSRPLYYTNAFPNDYGVTRYGFYVKVDPDDPAGGERVVILPALVDFLQIWSGTYHDGIPWNTMHYNLLLADYCHLVLSAAQARDGRAVEAFNPLIQFSCGNYQGLLHRIQFALTDEAVDPVRVASLIRQAGALRGQAFFKSELARLRYYQGLLDLRTNNIAGARRSFESAVKIWPHPENPARERLTDP